MSIKFAQETRWRERWEELFRAAWDAPNGERRNSCMRDMLLLSNSLREDFMQAITDRVQREQSRCPNCDKYFDSPSAMHGHKGQCKEKK